MKYEDWIRYEQQRENQRDIFAWVSLPEMPSLPNIKSLQQKSIKGEKNDLNFLSILRSLHF